jgi:hypothetical protein
MLEDFAQMEDEEVDRRIQQWHIGKEIPIALVIAFVLQTGAFLWSLSGLYSKVDSLVATTNEMRLERYTKEDGRRDRELMMEINRAQQQRDNEQDRRISNVEAFFNRWRGDKP